MTPLALPPELESYVADEIASGKFRSRDEVIAEALRLLQGRERRREALLADLEVGFGQLERGEVIRVRSAEEHKALFDGVRQELRERAEAREQA